MSSLATINSALTDEIQSVESCGRDNYARITLNNGWTLSIGWNPTVHYCTENTVELAVWPGTGAYADWLDLTSYDKVAGHVPEHLLLRVANVLAMQPDNSLSRTERVDLTATIQNILRER